MKNRKNLWMCIIALVSVLFIVILFGAASASKSAVDGPQEDVVSKEEQPVLQKEEEKTLEKAAEEAETFAEDAYEVGVFAFTVERFAKQFSKNLPEGYRFEDTAAGNPRRNNRLQLDIWDENGIATDISILFNAENTETVCKQLALTIKTDCSAEDADAILKWYLFTFLEEFDVEQKRAIYDEYLYMFDTGSEEYQVHAEGSQSAMMSCEEEQDGKYYYVLISSE